MTRQRTGKPAKAQGYHSQLLHVMGKYFPRVGLPLMTDDKRVRWTDRLLAIVAILMVWADATRVCDAFVTAREVAVSMYRSRRRPGRRLGPFLERLGASTSRLLGVLVPVLRQAAESASGSTWRWSRWVVMAVDGTRIDCPRTASNEQAFGCAGRKKTGPQQFLTTIFHLTTGLIWDWRRGRSDAAERTHLREMMGSLPEETLLVADAGFTGYDLLRSLMVAGRDFLIRVGANVTLLRGLGYAVWEDRDTVYLWPESKQDEAPLVLRLIQLRDDGKRCCLLTTVLDPGVLSNAEAKTLYRMRWKVEVNFRSLKQTLCRRKMLSTTPSNARVELDWAMVGLWLLSLMAVDHVARRDKPRVSVAATLRTLRQWMRRRTGRPPSKGLRGALRKAAVDRYTRRRPKEARDWPHKKRDKPPGSPKLRMATRAEVRKAKGLLDANRAA